MFLLGDQQKGDSGRFIDISMTAWAFAKAGQADAWQAQHAAQPAAQRGMAFCKMGALVKVKEGKSGEWGPGIKICVFDL